MEIKLYTNKYNHVY